MRQRRWLGAALVGVLALVPVAVLRPAVADDVVVSQSARFTASDGVQLQTTLTGRGPLAARPTVVEFSPYGRDSQTLDVGPDFNFLLVQLRGTGDSDGRFDVMGPRTQQDVAEVLRWACGQPWSDGNLALNGFSASAIIVYNSLHEQLPCVRAAVLKSGTFDLYRDLLWPGGISNIVPGFVVLAGIGGITLAQGGNRLARDPATGLDALLGMVDSGAQAGLLHPTRDSFWQERAFRGDVNHLPILMVDGFFDVESRGAFQAYQALRGDGAHLLVVGGHDGAPVGTDDGVSQAHAWLDHYVRGVANGAPAEPRVQLLMSDGDRRSYLAGDFVRRDATDWPVPGTTWPALRLDPQRSGSASSLNDGSLRLGVPALAAVQAYPAVPTLPTTADVPNAAIIGAAGVDAVTDALPVLADMRVAESVGLTYTTRPLSHDVDVAGPAALELPLLTTTPESPIWAVLSDVAPDGTVHPLTVGRLDTSYPGVDDAASLHADGAVVQPYGDYATWQPAFPLVTRRYEVELWPLGNRFRAGHRLRLELVGESLASRPALPGLNAVTVGGRDGAVLRLPVLPGSDLASALG